MSMSVCLNISELQVFILFRRCTEVRLSDTVQKGTGSISLQAAG